MVFRTLFNEPRPKGFLEIGEVLDLLDIDVDDDDRLDIEVSCDPKDEPKFNEITHGFTAEVRYYAGDDEPVTFTTLGYRSLDELHRDMQACNFDIRDFEYTFSDDLRNMTFTDAPDESTINTIESKTEDFAAIREATASILSYVQEGAYALDPQDEETQHRVKALGDRLKHELEFANTFGDPIDLTARNHHELNKENPDMAFKQEIFTLVGALTASVHRAQTELLETNRLALALSDKIGQQAFNERVETTELHITIDTSPISEALEALSQRVSTGLDADAQTSVEGSTTADYVATKDIIEEAANKATEASVKQVEETIVAQTEEIAPSTDDFDAAVEDAIAANVAKALAVEIPADAPKPLPTSTVKSVPSVPPVEVEAIDQSDDAKDFRAIVQFFLNNNTGTRDQLDIESSLFNATWDHTARRIKADLTRYLVKVPTSKMIWTARLNSLFKKFCDTTVDAVLYGTTTPVTMKLTRDADGSYSFIKV